MGCLVPGGFGGSLWSSRWIDSGFVECCNLGGILKGLEGMDLFVDGGRDPGVNFSLLDLYLVSRNIERDVSAASVDRTFAGLAFLFQIAWGTGFY